MIDRLTARRTARRAFRIAVAMAMFAGIALGLITSARATLSGSFFDASDGNLNVDQATKDWANTVSCTSTQSLAWCGIDKPSGFNDND